MPIHLQPQDWRWATWRSIPPLEPPSIRPFEPGTLLADIFEEASTWYWWVRPLSAIKPGMSREEAHFWLSFISEISPLSNKPGSARMLAEKMASMTFDGDISEAEVKRIFSSSFLNNYISPTVTLIPMALLPLSEVIEFLAAPNNVMTIRHIQEGLYSYVMPYLTDEQRHAARGRIRPYVEEVAADTTITSLYQTRLTILYAAAMLGGFSKEIARLLRRLPDNLYSNSLNAMGIEILFGLEDPDAIIREARRLAHPLVFPRHIIGWLANTETKALDYIYATITHPQQTRAGAQAAFTVFGLVEDEAIVPYVISLHGKTHVAKQAASWLNTHSEVAAQGAAQMALAGGTNSNKARDLLRNLRRKGALETLNAVYDWLPEALRARYKAEILEFKERTAPVLTQDETPEWLSNVLAVPVKPEQTRRKATLNNAPPTWVDYAELPPLVLESGAALSSQHGDNILTILRHCTLEKQHPLIGELKSHIAGVLLDKFVCELFQIWQQRGADIKEKWVLFAVGLLGGDVAALKLTTYIKNMPGRQYNKRALIATACIGAIGTSTAVMQLSTIATLPGTSRINRVKEEAVRAINRIAVERQLTPDQLADSIVPDCGLDTDGQRTFDYGARQFQFLLSPQLKPAVKSADGKIKTDLPKPTMKDDLQRAGETLLEWRVIKQQVRAIAKSQSERLEIAMVQQRRWTLPQFHQWFVNHPLMIHLVRRLIWGVYLEDHSPVQVFRVTNEHDFADAQDTPLQLVSDGMVGLVHPVSFSDDERQAWSGMLKDYEVIPPFQQIGRSTPLLDEEERAARTVIRYTGTNIHSRVFFGMLSGLRWQPGYVQDFGTVYSKTFPYMGVTALMSYRNAYSGTHSWEQQRIEKILFLAYTDQSALRRMEEALRLRDVPQVALAETLRDIEILIKQGAISE